MLRFFKRRPRRRELVPYRTAVSVADTNPDLRIRNLLDDPGLRRSLGLDAPWPAPVLETAA